MTKLNFYSLLLASYGLLQCSAAISSIELEIDDHPKGCINITDCSYGCAELSTDTVKNVLTPLCEPEKMLSADFIQKITIRGSASAPYLLDEDRSHTYNCTKAATGTLKYTCNFNSDLNPPASSSIETNNIASANVNVNENASVKPSSSIGLSYSSPSILVQDTLISKQVIRCNFDTSIAGQGKGQGNLYDCCLTSEDCYGSCFQGSCDRRYGQPSETTTSSAITSSDVEPSSSSSPMGCDYNPTIFRQRRGQGNLNDCCFGDSDCHGSCIIGACDAENNMPIPVCSGEGHRGKGRGEGPEGACCDSQADCQEDCLFNTCTAPLNY